MHVFADNIERQQGTVLGGLFRLIGELMYCFSTMDPKNTTIPLRRFMDNFSDLEHFALKSGEQSLQNSLCILYSCTEKILVDKELWEKAQSEYQALFLAPDLPVPLWESLYLSGNNMLFTKETTAVREWYRRFALDIQTVGYEAEDHIAFELFFCGWLFDNSTVDYATEITKYQPNLDNFNLFFKEHLGLWGIQCISSLKQASSTPFWLAFFSTTIILLEIVSNEVKV